MPDVIRRFATCRSGVSAVEFALIAPALILLFVGAIELPRFFAMNQSVTRASRAMADLLSLGTPSNLNDIYAAGRAVADPYDIGTAGVVLTAVGVYKQNDALKAKVCSSAARNGPAHPTGATLAKPASEYGDKGRYLLVETRFKYQPIFNVIPFVQDYTFSETVHWPVRNGEVKNGDPEIVLPGGQACPAT
jgi:Flp pilus assembly protein TadG